MFDIIIVLVINLKLIGPSMPSNTQVLSDLSPLCQSPPQNAYNGAWSARLLLFKVKDGISTMRH